MSIMTSDNRVDCSPTVSLVMQSPSASNLCCLFGISINLGVDIPHIVPCWWDPRPPTVPLTSGGFTTHWSDHPAISASQGQAIQVEFGHPLGLRGLGLGEQLAFL